MVVNDTLTSINLQQNVRASISKVLSLIGGGVFFSEVEYTLKVQESGCLGQKKKNLSVTWSFVNCVLNMECCSSEVPLYMTLE